MSKRTYFTFASEESIETTRQWRKTIEDPIRAEGLTRSEMLLSLADTLLPLDLRRNGVFAMYNAVTGDLERIDRTRSTLLSRIEFTYRADPQSRRTRAACALTLTQSGKLAFTCTVRPNSKWRITLDPDLDRFEERYDREARAAPGIYRAIIGTKPSWCYVLLSMLVYTDQVFCDPALEHRIRLQHAHRSGPAYAILKEFWDVKPEGELYPFLVRLMKPEFALRLDASRFHRVFHDGGLQLRITM